ncbi:M28 family peptidase [Micromonospora sp. NPDC047074]|uniref:M28 family peptidase n=1 Tax=Micromonospora sp. NPDC047074 TaxID=3154339 RepID=UPI0033F5267C
MRAVLALVLGVTLAVPAGGSGGAGDAGKLWLADRLEGTVSGAAATHHLAAWQRIADRTEGTRATGTRGFAQSADYLTRRLTDAGYRVTRQPVPYQDFRFDAERITELTPNAAPIRTYLLRFSPTTPVGGIEAPVAVVPDTDPTPGCEPSDFAGLPVRGAVVLAPRGSCGLTRQEQVAAEAGARALLLYRILPRPDNLYRTAVPNPAAATIPIATITQRRAQQLAADVAASPVPIRLHLELRGHTVSGITENILAETAGGRSDRTVVAGAHLDSATEGPGLNDNASSAAALLQTALALAPAQRRIRNKVRFAWWGAEELVILGSTHYVANLTARQRSDIALYLNWELLGSANFGRFVMDGVGAPAGSTTVAAIFAGYYADRGLAHSTVPDAAIGSDHEPFARAGIPTGGFHGGTTGIKTVEEERLFGGQAGQMYDSCYHQACDRIESMSLAEFDRNTRAVAWLVGRFALDVDEVVAPLATT